MQPLPLHACCFLPWAHNDGISTPGSVSQKPAVRGLANFTTAEPQWPTRFRTYQLSATPIRFRTMISALMPRRVFNWVWHAFYVDKQQSGRGPQTLTVPSPVIDSIKFSLELYTAESACTALAGLSASKTSCEELHICNGDEFSTERLRKKLLWAWRLQPSLWVRVAGNWRKKELHLYDSIVTVSAGVEMSQPNQA